MDIYVIIKYIINLIIIISTPYVFYLSVLLLMMCTLSITSVCEVMLLSMRLSNVVIIKTFIKFVYSLYFCMIILI